MQKRHMALIAGLLVAIAGAGTTLWWMYRGKVVPPPPVGAPTTGCSVSITASSLALESCTILPA